MSQHRANLRAVAGWLHLYHTEVEFIDRVTQG
jgi:hypothetical protein